jgi:flavin reductase (DIM6/NTAB) family NADH-FMN oxidoreductase RutF
MPGVDAAQFRQLMGRFATGVSVLTTRRPDGRLVGMTASSIASVSLTPPLLLVCVDHKNDMHDAMAAATHFAVNILAADQEALARRFAAIDPNRFDGVGYRASRLGIPLLDGALAHLECSKQNAVPGGDHTVFFGLVSNGTVTNARPLLYYRGGYAGL